MTTKYYVADLEVYWAAEAALPLPGVPQAVLDAFDTAVLVCDARQPVWPWNSGDGPCTQLLA